MTASGCCGAAAGAGWNAIRRCGRRCSGPISSSPAQERALFDRLAVFAGGFDLDGAEAVCADDTIDPLDVGDLLAALVDKSMVVADRHGPHTRYRLLETLRQYGEERLAEDGELAPLRDRHLDHYVGHGTRREPTGRGRRLRRRHEHPRSRMGQLPGGPAMGVDHRRRRTGRRVAGSTALLRHDADFASSWASGPTRSSNSARQAPTSTGSRRRSPRRAATNERALRLAQTGLAAPTPSTRKGVRICLGAVARGHWFSGHVAEGWAAVNTWDAMADPAEDPADAVTAALFVASFAVIVDPPSAAAHLARARRIAGPLANPALDTHIAYASGLVERAAGHYDVALAHFRQGHGAGRPHRQPALRRAHAASRSACSPP